MELIIRVTAFIGTVSAFAGAIYILILNINTRKLTKLNIIFSLFFKTKTFFLMKNGGNNPCDIKEDFKMLSFPDVNLMVEEGLKND